MPPHTGLGEFEQLVLLAVLRIAAAGDDPYGVSIVDEIDSRTRRGVARAAVYVTMRRLEDKGLLASWMSDPSDTRGGKARRCVRITAAGRKALRASRQALDQMWSGLETELETGR
jgi:DNA-binding PadR family transcriptional regulator